MCIFYKNETEQSLLQILLPQERTFMKHLKIKAIDSKVNYFQEKKKKKKYFIYSYANYIAKKKKKEYRYIYMSII